MALGNQKTMVSTNRLKERVAKLLGEMIASDKTSTEYKELAQQWIDNCEDADKTKEIAPKLRKCIAESAAKGCPVCKELQTLDHYLVKRSQWIIGGDGASYDIGYGGLDHVIASGEDVNILVLDTEVYSNTGGQASKATPLGAIAQFAAQGKRIRKKDLGMILRKRSVSFVAERPLLTVMSMLLRLLWALTTHRPSSDGAARAEPSLLGLCRVATELDEVRAIREAEAWHGLQSSSPTPPVSARLCRLLPTGRKNHSLKAKGGMGKSQAEEKKAVECGYWHLWRFNPALIEEGKNPFSLDSKEPNWANFHDLTLSSSVATRHSPSKLGSALAAPSVPARRGPLPLRQEGLPQRGRGTLRRGPAHGPNPLQDLRPQDAGGLERVILSKLEGFVIPTIIIKGASISGAPLIIYGIECF